MSLRQDKTVAQLRSRVEAALHSAHLLHQRLLEARALQDATDPGDTSHPVAAESLLSLLQDDFQPVANSANVCLEVNCEPAMVRGNETRLKSGFFHLFEYLLCTRPPLHTVRILARRISSTVFQVTFGEDDSPCFDTVAPSQALFPDDTGLHIAQRIFQATGGDLVMTENASVQIAGYVRLLLAD